MREIRWASYCDGYVEVNGRPAGARATAMMRKLGTTDDDNAVIEQWYRLSRIRSAYRAKSRGWRSRG